MMLRSQISFVSGRHSSLRSRTSLEGLLSHGQASCALVFRASVLEYVQLRTLAQLVFPRVRVLLFLLLRASPPCSDHPIDFPASEEAIDLIQTCCAWDQPLWVLCRLETFVLRWLARALWLVVWKLPVRLMCPQPALVSSDLFSDFFLEEREYVGSFPAGLALEKL